MPHEAKPAAKRRAKPSAPTIFLPTLLPDPFGEGSPELCWELREGPAKIALRLTQFGWSASCSEGAAASYFKADLLADLREEVSASDKVPASLAAKAKAPWVLAYEADGL